MLDKDTHPLTGCGELAMALQEEARRTAITGLSLVELAEQLKAQGLQAFRAKQIWGFLYSKGMTSFDTMHTLPKRDREWLSEHYAITRPEPVQDHLSTDGTRKWLFRLEDGQEVETVFIPEEDRGTLCISSQVGCTLSCTFCHTGTQRLVRNLRADEIVAQVLSAKDLLSQEEEGDWPDRTGERKITNIVFMGMGEPMMNYDHVKQACDILIDRDGLAFSRRKVTISTSGVVPRITQMADELGVNLALSLHATNDTLRDGIVPINKKYPLKELLESCHYYISKHPRQRIFVEYVMLKDVNDSDEDARNMIALLRDLPVKINLIPFNPWPGSPYICSSNNRIHAFKRILEAAGLAAPIRTTRGEDILAACGQLKSESQLKKGEKVKLH